MTLKSKTSWLLTISPGSSIHLINSGQCEGYISTETGYWTICEICSLLGQLISCLKCLVQSASWTICKFSFSISQLHNGSLWNHSISNSCQIDIEDWWLDHCPRSNLRLLCVAHQAPSSCKRPIKWLKMAKIIDGFKIINFTTPENKHEGKVQVDG